MGRLAGVPNKLTTEVKDKLQTVSDTNHLFLSILLNNHEKTTSILFCQKIFYNELIIFILY